MIIKTSVTLYMTFENWLSTTDGLEDDLQKVYPAFGIQSEWSWVDMNVHSEATVMSVTTLCWWHSDGDGLRCWWQNYYGGGFFLLMVILNVRKLSSTSNSFQQHISSPTSVTDNDVVRLCCGRKQSKNTDMISNEVIVIKELQCCWWLSNSESLKMLVVEKLCWWLMLHKLCNISYVGYQQLVSNIENRSSASSNKRQNPSPTSM